MTDQDLIEQCLRGDESAWATLVERYGRLVYAMPRRFGLDAETADDVFQEVFVVLLRQLPGLRNRSALPKWLMQTALHVTRRTLRRRQLSLSPELEQVLQAPPTQDDLGRWERDEDLHRALGRLSASCRDLLLALYGPGQMEYRQVAEHLAMPIGSIGPTRARCLRKLLELITLPSELADASVIAGAGNAARRKQLKEAHGDDPERSAI